MTGTVEVSAGHYTRSLNERKRKDAKLIRLEKLLMSAFEALSDTDHQKLRGAIQAELIGT